MWHVDEGTLHAYLDDRERGPAAGALEAETRARVAAHVAACASCAAQLRLAERQRARVNDILAAASPVLENPPFEALQPAVAPALEAMQPATATRGRAAANRRPRPAWVQLAWAASLVLAVGAGWIGSVLWRSGDAARRTAQASEAAPPAAPAPASNQTAGASLQAADPSLQTDAAPAEARSAAPSLQTAATSADAGSAEARGDVAPSAPARLGGVKAPEARLAAGEPRPGGVVARGEVAAGGGATGQVAAGAPPRPLAEVAPTAARAEREQLAAVDQAAKQVTRPASAGAAKALEERALDVVRNRVGQQENLVAPTRFLDSPASLNLASLVAAGYPGDADVAWETVTREAAERLLGGPLYLLAGAAIEELAVATEAAPAPLVRLRQRTGSGQVELLQWRAPPEAQGAPAGRNAAAAAGAAASRDAAVPPRAAAPVPSAAGTVPPAAAALVSPVQSGRTRDGGRFIVVPGTTHVVLLLTAANVDPLSLLPRLGTGR